MTTTSTPGRTRADIGRAARLRGIATERDLARYLRACGWPDAERKTDTGWAARDRSSADHGDIRGTAGLCWQVKSQETMTDTQLVRAMDALAAQSTAAGAQVGILVHRRAGRGDPGHWWAFLKLGPLCLLLGQTSDANDLDDPWRDVPCRLVLDDLLPILHRAGYGSGQAA
jgi:hypothetical protein